MGITCFGHDSSAAIIKDGVLITVTEEERFTRVKHCHDFPVNSIQHCLDEAGIGIEDISHVGYYLKPWIGYPHYFFHFLKYFPRSLSLLTDRKIAVSQNDYIAYGPLTNPVQMFAIKDLFYRHWEREKIRFRFHFLEHHICHQASSFLVSPFDEAACLSMDGSGEWTTTMLAHGRGNDIRVISRIMSPQSLGVFYNSVCEYLGFSVLDGPGKVMGLASYGDRDKYYDQFKRLIAFKDNGRFQIDLSYFNYHLQRTKNRCSDKFTAVFGPARKKDEKLNTRHEDIAAALQRISEDAIVHILKHLKSVTKAENLCLSGGVALNSVANGKVLREGLFKNVFIQPAASDGGCSLGACMYIYNVLLGKPRAYVFQDACLGKEFSNVQIKRFLDDEHIQYRHIEHIEKETALMLSKGKIVGWFQGKSEFGPRALGCRSILADPRKAEMKDILNDKVKHRESFRPFAPSVLAEKCADYFETGYPSPYMLLVYNVRDEKKKVIPAVTHVDGTARVQTVEKSVKPLYWQLIKEFDAITGVPVILNTSFNVQGEPIVNSPADAYRCFMSTQMDNLVMGNYLLSKE